MTAHRGVPSDVEPETLADLIGDCERLPAALRPRPRTVDLTRLPRPRVELRIPEPTTSLVHDYADYGV